MTRALLVILQDRLSALIRKGEVTPRYYNPGDLFERVHILMTNNDRVDPAAVQPLVGRARLSLHYLQGGIPLFINTLGWRPDLLARWAWKALPLVQRLKPDLIHCPVNSLNGALGAMLKERLSVPLVVSLHVNPDEDLRGRRGWFSSPLKRLALERHRRIERTALEGADVVVCVYPFLEAYARRYGARRTEVIYNALNSDSILLKKSYELHSPVRILNVGRQFAEKDPSVLVRAIAPLPDVELTLIGTGPYHQRLRRLAEALDVGSRVRFIPSLANALLCQQLQGYDLFASVNEYGGVSKAVLEAMAAGLPIAANARIAQTEPLVGEAILSHAGSSRAFEEAFRQLLRDEPLRRRLGMAARQVWEAMDIAGMEERRRELFSELIGKREPLLSPC